MKIEINRCFEGAKKAIGITVVIDVFRASNTILACFERGANSIIPIGDLEDAFELKKKNPNMLLFGERGGLPPKGFDYGNSPANSLKMNLTNKDIILTTSAGSQGIVSSKNADEILIGSFANAKSIVNYIREKNPANVTLLAIGNEAIESATEDEECAKYLKALLEGTEIDLELSRKEMLACKGADRLRRLSQIDDLEFCLGLNQFSSIPKYNRITGKLYCVEL